MYNHLQIGIVIFLLPQLHQQILHTDLFFFFLMKDPFILEHVKNRIIITTTSLTGVQYIFIVS